MAKDRARDPARRPKLNAFGRTDEQEQRQMKFDAQEVAAEKEARTKEYGAHPDGYVEIRSNKPSMWRA